LVQVEAQQALGQLSEKPGITVDKAVPWQVLLSRFQPMRWLALGMFVAGAVWLAVGNRRLVTAPIRQQADCQDQGRA
jgi:hypothetical protein